MNSFVTVPAINIFPAKSKTIPLGFLRVAFIAARGPKGPVGGKPANLPATVFTTPSVMFELCATIALPCNVINKNMKQRWNRTKYIFECVTMTVYELLG